jgi:hypothetical protein
LDGLEVDGRKIEKRADADWKYVARIGLVAVRFKEASVCITKTTCLLTDSEDETCLVELLANLKKQVSARITGPQFLCEERLSPFLISLLQEIGRRKAAASY